MDGDTKKLFEIAGSRFEFRLFSPKFRVSSLFFGRVRDSTPPTRFFSGAKIGFLCRSEKNTKAISAEDFQNVDVLRRCAALPGLGLSMVQAKARASVDPVQKLVKLPSVRLNTLELRFSVMLWSIGNGGTS